MVLCLMHPQWPSLVVFFAQHSSAFPCGTGAPGAAQRHAPSNAVLVQQLLSSAPLRECSTPIQPHVPSDPSAREQHSLPIFDASPAWMQRHFPSLLAFPDKHTLFASVPLRTTSPRKRKSHFPSLIRLEQQSCAPPSEGTVVPDARHRQTLSASFLSEQQWFPPSAFAPTAVHFEAKQFCPSLVTLPEQQSRLSAPLGNCFVASLMQPHALPAAFFVPVQQFS